MAVEIMLDTPLGQALNTAIQPKLVEMGWSAAGSDDTALAEYIMLMLANAKTQEQIAEELAGDLLSLGPDDPGARDFSQWLFQQVHILSSQQDGQSAPDVSTEETSLDFSNGVHDTDEMEGVSETGDSNVPTGPKSMRNGGNGAVRGRDKRMLGHLSKAMDRNNDAVLHRVRPQNGNERINSHSRGPPTGPRQQPGRGGIGARHANNRMTNALANMTPQQGALATNVMNMTPNQQMELYAMLEQQSKLMAQMLNPQGAPFNNGMGGGFQQQAQSGRSLFERVSKNPRQNQNNGFQRGPQHNKFEHRPSNSEPSSSMDVEMSQEKKEIDPETTACKFNLSCTVADCKFAHQSSAAPVGTPIDFSDTCSFGGSCQNKKCTAKHPSPASHLQQICKFYPSCTKGPACPFRHPAKQCRNGGDCSVPGCTFAHTTTMCRFTPCTRPDCTFKHAEGQRGVFKDKVWTPNNGTKEHVSERKFVNDDGPEELIVPGSGGTGILSPGSNATNGTAEIIT